ncbi:MAG: tetratricopeptide repeat protein [Vicinamibacterales bacterium]
MVRRGVRRPAWMLVLVMLAAVAMAVPAFAQGGMVKGTVRDEQGAVVDGAKISFLHTASGRKFESRSDKKGEFIQIGLPTGAYQVTAEKERLASLPAPVSVSAKAPAAVSLIVSAAAGANTKASQEALAKLKAIFEQGVAASNSGDHAGAIAKFQEGIAVMPNCGDCYNNIGFSYGQLKDYPKAEEAYKKAAEIRPKDPTPWNGLADIYTAQRKSDEAVAASTKAAELAGASGGLAGAGANADVMYNQGVTLFNAGKANEALEIFEQIVKSSPDHAEAHYMYGLTLAAKDPKAARLEFVKYLELAPSGPNAATAKQFADSLPQ